MTGVEPLLAQELLDEIIDLLEFDTWTLKACSLAGRNFLHRCRPILFREVELHFGGDTTDGDACMRLTSALRSNRSKACSRLPSIRTLISHVRIIDLSIPSAPRKSPFYSSDIPLLFSLCPFITDLTLLGGGVQWESFPEPFRQATQRLLQGPSSHLIGLTLFDLSFMNDKAFHHVFHSNRLERLELKSVDLREQDSKSVPTHMPSLRSLSLRIDGDSQMDIVLPLWGSSSLPQLRGLSLGSSCKHLGRIRELFSATQHVVQTLKIGYVDPSVEEPMTVEFSQLRSITFVADNAETKEDQDNYLRWCSDLLQQCPIIEEVNFHVSSRFIPFVAHLDETACGGSNTIRTRLRVNIFLWDTVEWEVPYGSVVCPSDLPPSELGISRLKLNASVYEIRNLGSIVQ